MATNDNKTPIIGISLNKDNAIQALKTVLQSETVEPIKLPDPELERFYLMFMSNKLLTHKGSDYTIAFHSFIPVYKSGIIAEMPYSAGGSKPPYDYLFETKNKIIYTFEGEHDGLVSNKPRKVKVIYKPTLVIYLSKNDSTKPLEEQQYIATRCIENQCVLQIIVDDKLCYQYVGTPVFNEILKEKTMKYIKHISADVLKVDVKDDDIKIL